MTYESPEERRQRAGIIEVPLPGKSAKKLNGGSHNGAERRHGNGATRGQIEGVDFRPEIESHKAERAQSEPLPVAPAPAYVSVFPFTMSERGLFKRIRAKGADGGDEEGDEDTAVEKHVLRTVHVSAPFEILGKCRDPDGNSQGLLLRWSDDDGRTHIQFVPYSALYGDAAALCGGLADGGLPVDERRVRDIKRYFRSVEVDARVTRVTRTGWHEICGKKVFVLPGGTIGNDSSEVVMLDGSRLRSRTVPDQVRTNFRPRNTSSDIELTVAPMWVATMPLIVAAHAAHRGKARGKMLSVDNGTRPCEQSGKVGMGQRCSGIPSFRFYPMISIAFLRSYCVH